MSSPSNLYAEKVFSEHPTVLWALDDKADYISLITNQQRDLTTWDIKNGTVINFPSVLDEPFIDAPTSKIIGDIPTEELNTVVCVSDDLVNFNTLNREYGTFAVGTYIYSLSPYIASIQIGYEYNDVTTGEVVRNLKNFNTSVYDAWTFVSETFSVPQDNTTMRAVIAISYLNASENQNDYHFLINGVTVGQWSEEFNAVSLGIQPVQIPSTINLPTLYGIEAKAYGLLESTGYYILDESSLSSKNSGVPMVYGSSNITVMVPNDNNYPSLILPGHGFLNDVGKYNEYTCEMWLRINASTTEPKRIFGPIGSTDGLYVDGPFLVLKIDNNVGSHYVGEWTRPMLVHIRITKDSASLLINGDQVISLSFITDNLSFPSEYENNKNQDWLGFYSYVDASPIEIDCVAIYTYSVPSLVAKKRFVYGQGVELPENINSAYSGTSAVIDYPFANYTNNYNYPDLGKWDQGLVDNLYIQNNILSTPNYALPEIVLQSKTKEDLYADCKAVQSEDDLFITLRPNSSWSNENGYLFFNDTNQINDQTVAFYGTFKITSLSSSRQTLLRLEDQNNGNYFSIDIVNSDIEYNLLYNNEFKNVYTSYGIGVGEIFSVGMNFQDFALYAGGDALAFLGNKTALKMYVAGTRNMTQTFLGKIYNVGLCNERNFSLISELFNSYGVPVEYENVFDAYTQGVEFDAGLYMHYVEQTLDGGDWEDWRYELTRRIKDHVASYTLVPYEYFDNFGLDINVSGYWEDNLPLTYFAKYIQDKSGNQKYDLDFIQFNLNYPAPSNFEERSINSSWTYSQLQAEYGNPIQRDYSSLDNELYTGYQDYVDLQNRADKIYYYDTSKSVVRSYISFQYTSTGANARSNYFNTTYPARSGGIVEPGSDWITSKYEVVDNMILYPPSGADFNDLSLVVHLDFSVKGILRNSVKIKKLQLASQSLNESSITEIGTRFGVPMYPYRKNGFYYDYKNPNPYSIYKGSSPYLYLTRYSGIQVKGKYDPLINRGVAIPINSGLASNYQVMAMQVAVRYDQDLFPFAATQIFEVDSKGSLLKFFMEANSPTGDRARIYAINANTGRIENGITFYLNGNIVREPVITTRQWAFIGISFSNVLNFNNYLGSFKINGPILTNLISHYQSTNLQEVQTVTKRPWFKVRFSGPVELDWQYWNSSYIWNGVLVLSSTSYYGVKPSDIYKSYTGTNKIIVDDYNALEANPKVLSFGSYEYNVYSDVSWQSRTVNAV